MKIDHISAPGLKSNYFFLTRTPLLCMSASCHFEFSGEVLQSADGPVIAWTVSERGLCFGAGHWGCEAVQARPYFSLVTAVPFDQVFGRHIQDDPGTSDVVRSRGDRLRFQGQVAGGGHVAGVGPRPKQAAVAFRVFRHGFDFARQFIGPARAHDAERQNFESLGFDKPGCGLFASHLRQGITVAGPQGMILVDRYVNRRRRGHSVDVV